MKTVCFLELPKNRSIHDLGDRESYLFFGKRGAEAPVIFLNFYFETNFRRESGAFVMNRWACDESASWDES